MRHINLHFTLLYFTLLMLSLNVAAKWHDFVSLCCIRIYTHTYIHTLSWLKTPTLECSCQTPARAARVSTAGQLDARCAAAESFPPLSHSSTCVRDLQLMTNANSPDMTLADRANGSAYLTGTVHVFVCVSVMLYDTWWTILTCAQKLTRSQLSLPHGTKQKRIMKKLKT